MGCLPFEITALAATVRASVEILEIGTPRAISSEVDLSHPGEVVPELCDVSTVKCLHFVKRASA